LGAVEPVYDALVSAIAAREGVILLCADGTHEAAVRARLARCGTDLSRVATYSVPTDDTWTRDYGPITVLVDGEPLLLDFVFDGWGGKFEASDDDATTRRLHGLGAFGPTPLATVSLTLEGGSIESDGAGTLLATWRCLASRNAPPGREGAEAWLGELLGADRVLWLHHGGLEGDDTDGHVDTLARFCDPSTIAYVRCDDPGDTHHAELAAMEAELRAFRTPAGTPYRLVPLPWPRPKHDDNDHRLPATYANFLVVNGAVLLPVYDDPADEPAIESVRAAFPGREVVPIPALPLIAQHGSVHCVTMQVPRGVRTP
jgi:agmatine/peptidylarginine deiminase